MDCSRLQILLNPYLVTVIAVTVSVTLYYRHWNRIRNLTKNIHGPPEMPLFGNLGIFSDDFNFFEINNRIYRSFDRYGHVFKLWLGHELWICMCDCKLIRDISEYWQSYETVPSYNFFGYSKDRNYIKRTFYGAISMYDLLISPSLDKESFEKANEKLVSSLRSVATRGSAIQDIHSSMKDCMKKIMTDITWKVLANEDYRNKVYFPLQDRWDIMIWNIVSKVQDIVAMMTVRFMNSSYFKMEIFQGSQLEFDQPGQTKLNPRKSLLTPEMLNMDFTEKRLNHLSRPALEKTTLEISESMELTALFLTNLLQDLAANPDVVQKIRDEVAEARARLGGREPTIADERKLYYTEMVVNEGLRLYGKPGIFMRAGKDFTKGAVIVPKGTVCYLSVTHLHMNCDYYERPIEFYPEHFSLERQRDRPPATFFPLPLHPGSQAPDKRFMLKLLKMLLVTIVTNFSLETIVKKEDIVHEYLSLEKNLERMQIQLKLLKN